LNHKFQTESAVVLKLNDKPHTVSLNKVPNNYGGHDRIYFNCPRCHSRVRLLYVTKEALFCRNCVRLSYPSQRCGHDSKVFYQLDSLFRKLKANTDNEFMIKNIPPRPAYMRHETYVNLIERITALQNQHWSKFFDWAQNFINNRQKHTERKD
jgi:hypothetical protein